MKLGNELNEFVIKQVVHDFTNHVKINSSFKLAINLSFGAEQFQKNILKLAQLLVNSGLSTDLQFEFEITEGNVLLRDTTNSLLLKDLSDQLKKEGVSLAIDDFGTKQSSMNRIIECNFNTIKIDQCYIDRLDSKESKEVSAVIKATLSLAKDLNMTVIAEGAERQQQLTMLKRLGLKYVQGFVLSKPLPADELNKLLN
jgi:EAL domain-containing protein (putative c-di-GMP-specific phosphodiesterase class I)